jgi:catechol 2,3-dioxygenase-like lactoylglutathione lyase family enzyme
MTIVPQFPVELTLRGKTMSNWLVAALFCVGVLAVGGRADEKPAPPSSAKPDDKGKDKKPAFRTGAVRYQVKDVDKSVEFYTRHLGFEVEQHFGAGAAFGSVSNGGLTLWLSGPKSSGSRAMPDGRKQEPGGNQIQFEDPDGNPAERFQPASWGSVSPVSPGPVGCIRPVAVFARLVPGTGDGLQPR